MAFTAASHTSACVRVCVTDASSPFCVCCAHMTSQPESIVDVASHSEQVYLFVPISRSDRVNNKHPMAQNGFKLCRGTWFHNLIVTKKKGLFHWVISEGIRVLDNKITSSFLTAMGIDTSPAASHILQVWAGRPDHYNCYECYLSELFGTIRSRCDGGNERLLRPVHAKSQLTWWEVLLSLETRFYARHYMRCKIITQRQDDWSVGGIIASHVEPVLWKMDRLSLRRDGERWDQDQVVHPSKS